MSSTKMTQAQDSTNKDIIDKISKRVDYDALHEIDLRVSEIIHKVKNNGDKALAEYCQSFDAFEVNLDKENPFQKNCSGYARKLRPELKAALELAIERITDFHKKDLEHFNPESWLFEGCYKEKLGAKINPIESVAVYIPGGNAALVSTLMMTAIPAKIAGVKRIALFSPPEIATSILGLADILEIDEVYQLGGAQAVAAAAFGTESIEKFDKIVGPGNIYVSEAKKLLNGVIGIDGIYGPSELAILADDSILKTSDGIKRIAIDLLSQLEHGSGLESVLLVTSEKIVIDNVKLALNKEIENINYTDKQKITIRASIENWSAFIYESNFDKAIELINYYAPEHLELQLKEDYLSLAKEKITQAGAIFIGTDSCESLGDYLAGPSHCLPTAASAKFSSGLQISDFFKKTSILDFSQSKNIDELLKATAIIARAEGLEAHAKAAEYRIKDKN